MITFENIQQLEKYTLMTMHGLFNQLKLGIISIENAEHTLFTPYMLETLSSLGVKDSIVDLIHKGTELEDFAAFNLSIEDTVTVCLQRTEELLKQYKNVEFNDKILINWRIIQENRHIKVECNYVSIDFILCKLQAFHIIKFEKRYIEMEKMNI